MSNTGREQLASSIIGHASNRVSDEMQLRVIAYWTSVDPGLGARIAAGLGHDHSNAANGRGATEASELVAARANRA